MKLRICPTQWGNTSNRERALNISPALHAAIAASAAAQGCTLREAFAAAVARALDAAEARPS